MQLVIADYRVSLDRMPNYKTALAKRVSATVERLGQRAALMQQVENDRNQAQVRLLMQGGRGGF